MFKRPREDSESEVQGKALKLTVKFSPLVQTSGETGTVKQVNRIKSLDPRVVNQHSESTRTEPEASPEELELAKLTQETTSKVIESERLYLKLAENDAEIVHLSELIQTAEKELLSVTQHCDEMEAGMKVQAEAEKADLNTWEDALKRELAMLGTERKKQESVKESLQRVQNDSGVMQDYNNALERSCASLRAEVTRMEHSTEDYQVRRLHLHSQISSSVSEAEALSKEVSADQESVSFLQGEISSFATGVSS